MGFYHSKPGKMDVKVMVGSKERESKCSGSQEKGGLYALWIEKKNRYVTLRGNGMQNW